MEGKRPLREDLSPGETVRLLAATGSLNGHQNRLQREPQGSQSAESFCVPALTGSGFLGAFAVVSGNGFSVLSLLACATANWSHMMGRS